MMGELVNYFFVGIKGCAVVAGFIFAAIGVFLAVGLVASIIGGFAKLFGSGEEK